MAGAHLDVEARKVTEQGRKRGGDRPKARQVETADATPRPETPERRILQALADTETPLSQRQLCEPNVCAPAKAASTVTNATPVCEQYIRNIPGSMWLQ